MGLPWMQRKSIAASVGRSTRMIWPMRTLSFNVLNVTVCAGPTARRAAALTSAQWGIAGLPSNLDRKMMKCF